MHIIPVLDLKGGLAVHALRGDRAHYAPVEGVLGCGGDALALAAAYRDVLGCRSCYVADLDAIAGGPGHPDLIRELANLDLELWVDAGINTAVRAQGLADLGVSRVIVGSETLRSAEQLAELAAEFSPAQLVLSVDLKGGVLHAPNDIPSPEQLVALAADQGISRFILLDLARVGASAGPPLDLLGELRPVFPDLAFYAGGGVRGPGDLATLAQTGAAGALVATAFHKGVLSAHDLRSY